MGDVRDSYTQERVIIGTRIHKALSGLVDVHTVEYDAIPLHMLLY